MPRYLKDFVNVPDGGEVAAPDIRLKRGGTIAGCLQGLPTLPQGVRWSALVEVEGRHLEGPPELYQDGPMTQDLTFRIGPLPPGSYTLKARVGSYDRDKTFDPGRRWEGTSAAIAVQIGQETGSVVIPMSEVPTPQ